MASLSPSQSNPKNPDGIFKPISYKKSLLQLGKIPGYSNVQSSSTFRFRQAHKPIYILRYKKIEQGQLSYPKICPSYLIIFQSIGLSNAQRYTRRKHGVSPKQQHLN